MFNKKFSLRLECREPEWLQHKVNFIFQCKSRIGEATNRPEKISLGTEVWFSLGLFEWSVKMVRVGSAELRELLVPKLIILPEQFNQKQLSVRQNEPFHLPIDWFGQPVLTNLKSRKKCWSEQKCFKWEIVSICRTTLQREITTFSGLQLRRSFEISL